MIMGIHFRDSTGSGIEQIYGTLGGDKEPRPTTAGTCVSMSESITMADVYIEATNAHLRSF